MDSAAEAAAALPVPAHSFSCAAAADGAVELAVAVDHAARLAHEQARDEPRAQRAWRRGLRGPRGAHGPRRLRAPRGQRGRRGPRGPRRPKPPPAIGGAT